MQTPGRLRGLGSPRKQRLVQDLQNIQTTATASHSQSILSQQKIHSPNKENLSPTVQFFDKKSEKEGNKGNSKEANKRLMVLSPKFENGSQHRSLLSSPKSPSRTTASRLANSQQSHFQGDKINLGSMTENNNNNHTDNRPIPFNIPSLPSLTPFSKTDNSKDNDRHTTLLKPTPIDNKPDNTHVAIDEEFQRHAPSELQPSSMFTPAQPPPVTKTMDNYMDVDNEEEEEEFTDAKENDTDSSFLAISQSIRKNIIPQENMAERYSILANKRKEPENSTGIDMDKIPQRSLSPNISDIDDREIESDESSDSSPVSRNTFAFASLPAREPLTKQSLSKILSNSPEYSRHNSIVADADRMLLSRTSSSRSNTSSHDKLTIVTTKANTLTISSARSEVTELTENSMTIDPALSAITTVATDTSAPSAITAPTTSSLSQYPVLSANNSLPPPHNPTGKRVESVSSVSSVSSLTSTSSASSSKLKKLTETPKKPTKELKAPDSANSLMSRTAGGVLRFAKQLFFDPSSHEKRADESKSISTVHAISTVSQPTPAPPKSDTLSRLMAPTYASNRKNQTPVRIPSNTADSFVPPSPSPLLSKSSVPKGLYPAVTRSTDSELAPPSPEKKSAPRETPKLVALAAPSQIKAQSISSSTSSSTVSLGPKVTAATSSTAKTIPSVTAKPTNVKLTKQQLQPKSTGQQKVTLKIPLNGKKDVAPIRDSDNMIPKVNTSSSTTTAPTRTATIGPGTSLNAKPHAKVLTSTAPKKDTPVSSTNSTTKPKLPVSSNIRAGSAISSSNTAKAATAANPQARLLKRNPQPDTTDTKHTNKRSSDQAFGTPLADKSSAVPATNLRSTKTHGQTLLRTPSTSTITKLGTQLKKPSYANSSSSMMKSTLVQQAKVAANSSHNPIPQVEGVKFSSDKIRFGGPSTATTPGPSASNSKTTPNPFRQLPTISNSINKPHGLVFTPQQQIPETILPEIMSESEDDDDGNVLQDWANSPQLRYMLLKQQEIDPDQVFGPVAPLHLDEVFRNSRVSRFRPRSSSANWSGQDKLTPQEIERYAQEMGYRKD